MGQLTRTEMEKLLRKGESVLYEGEIITSIADLPTDAVLAKGDKEKEAAARKELKAQLDAISKQLEQLDESKPAAPVKSPAKAEAPKAETPKTEAPKAEPKKAAAVEEDEDDAEVKSSKPVAAPKPAEPAKSDKGK